MLKYRQFINESIIDTTKSGITKRELSDICNLFSDEGGSYEISVKFFEKPGFFDCFWFVKLECNSKLKEQMADIADEIGKRISNEVGEELGVGGRNSWLFPGSFTYVWEIRVPIGHYELLDFDIVEYEYTVIVFLLGLDLEKIGFSEEECNLLRSINLSPSMISGITLKQFGLLHEYLDIDLEKLGLGETDRNIAGSISRKLDNPVFK